MGSCGDGGLGDVKRPRGVTLMELMFTSAILLVVTSLMALLLVRTSRASLRGVLRVEMQQQAVVAMQHILGAMKKSCCAGISVRSGPAPRAICVCPISQPGLRAGEPAPVQNDGILRWSSFFLIYYHDPTRRQIRHREWPPGSVLPTSLETDRSNPRRLDADRLAEVLAGSASRESVLASGVTAFNLTYPPGGTDELYVQPLTIQIVQQREGNTGHGQPEVFSYSRTIFLAEQR